MKPFNVEAGKAGHETVVLLHASGSSSRQWDALAARLGSRFDVHAVDFHGHGTRESWHGARGLSLADDAALLEPVLERGRVHLVGHSYGGAVAFKLAQRHPHAIKSLVAYEPLLFRRLFDRDPDGNAAREVLAAAGNVRKALHFRSYRRAAKLFVDYWSGSGTWDVLSEARRQAVAVRMPSVMLHFDALFAEDPAESMRSSAAPMLFLSGAATVPSARRVVALLRSAFPMQQHEVLDHMGHMGPLTHADVVNRSIERFLCTVQGARHEQEARLAA